jgi:hypothetical protein
MNELGLHSSNGGKMRNTFNRRKPGLPSITAALAIATAIASGLSSCSQSVRKDGSMSLAEQDALKNPPFDPNSAMTGVEGDSGLNNGDSPYPSVHADATDPDFIKHCSPDRFEGELREALETAAADTTKNTIVVRYSYSFGAKDKWDYVARMAYERSTLRKSDDGYTPIVVDNESNTKFQGTYLAEHKNARKDYIAGRKCFFNTITIKEKAKDYSWTHSYKLADGRISFDHMKPAAEMPAGATRHDYWPLRAMYIGEKYNCTSNCTAWDMSPRLFKDSDSTHAIYSATLDSWRDEHSRTKIKLSEYINKCPQSTRAQILPLYMADIRSKRFTIPFETDLLDPKFTSTAVRMKEYQVKIKSFLRLPLLVKYRELIERELSEDYESPDYQGKEVYGGTGTKIWGALEGVQQLIDNLIWSGMNATVVSFQYTPIILNLEGNGIRTSSVEAGTFFNLGNWVKKSSLSSTGRLVSPVVDIQHATAWVGGPTVKLRDETFGTVTKPVYARRSTDGFLAVPTQVPGALCEDGSPEYRIDRGLQLFGAYGNTEDGDAIEFENGFVKLRDYIAASGDAPKECEIPDEIKNKKRTWTNAELKKRYFGPWDAQAYSKVKVWVDANRNGVPDCGEIKSLKQAKVAAINTCNIVYQQTRDGKKVPARDQFGNATHLRAAFLTEPSPTASEETILKMLGTGEKVDGMKPEFRVAADILFKTNVGTYLQDVESDDIVEVKTPSKATTQ